MAPLPSEVILPLAGFTASQGEMNLVAALVWTTLGSVVGAMALYGIGGMIGRDRVRALAGLARRVAALDGRFSVHSPPGGPTVITAELPCG